MGKSSANRSSHRLSGDWLVLAARPHTDPSSPRLMMAVSRKLVPSSPVRNLVRRVIRESHRRACQAQPRTPDDMRLNPTQHDPVRLDNWSLRIQLLGLPHDPDAPHKDARGQAIKVFKRRLTDGQLKRQLRTDMDSLLVRLTQRLAKSVP